MFLPMIFPNKIPTARSHQAFFHGFASDGIIAGCPMSANGYTVTIGNGFINCGGAEVEASGINTITVSGSSGYARIKGVVDLSKSDATEDFKQFYLKADYASSLTGFPALTQQDFITGAGTKYEFQLAMCQLGASGVTQIIPSYVQPKVQMGTSLPSTGYEGEIFFLKVD